MKKSVMNKIYDVCDGISWNTNLGEMEKYIYYASHICKKNQEVEEWEMTEEDAAKTIVEFEKESNEFLRLLKLIHDEIEKKIKDRKAK